MSEDGVQVPVSQRYQVVNDQRVVVFTGRDQFALNDTSIAVPFALLKFLAGTLVTLEGQVEMARLGMTLNTEGTPRRVT